MERFSSMKICIYGYPSRMQEVSVQIGYALIMDKDALVPL